MSLITRILAKLADLPPAETYDILVEHDLEVPTHDGTILLTDRYAPRNRSDMPTVLMRSPYGRDFLKPMLMLWAERGFQLVIQSTRGTFGSGGKFNPFIDEKEDGLATIEWLKKQSWYNGKLAMFGPSYLGYVQWAVAEAAGDDLDALGILVSASEFQEHGYPGGTFALQTSLQWIYLLSVQERPFAQLYQLVAALKLPPIYKQLPLQKLDKLATGSEVFYYQDWLVNDRTDSEYWQKRNHDHTVTQVDTPIFLTGGWYDILLPWKIRDYCALREAGKRPYLTVGPWQHAAMGLLGTALRENMAFFKAHLQNDDSQLREKPVRIYVTGAEEWREYDDYPVPNTETQHYYLQANGALSQSTPPDSQPDPYRYDPADPTPAVSGACLLGNSSPKDNRKLEARPDVLTYTSERLSEAVEVIGIVRVELYVKSSNEHTDFFARLCDVHENGKSINVCDMIIRLKPNQPEAETDGTRHITLDLWPAAHRFKRGHQIRLQISSGAHPRFALNTGSGESLASASTLVPAGQSIYHDPQHRSCVILPVATAIKG